MVKEVTDASFEQDVLNSDIPVIVDFWAEWCGPCRQLAPIVEDVAKEMEGTVKIVKMNIEDSPETPSKYAVRGIPNMILFKDGKMLANKVGALPKSALIKWINDSLA